MEKTGSITIIAENLKLSRATVSLVLNGRGDDMRISRDTQTRVIDEAKKLGYKPNIHARRLRQKATSGKTVVIGVLWASMYTAEILIRFFEGIQKAILEDGADVEIVYKPFVYNEINKISSVFENSLFNGVIIVGASDCDIDYIKGINYTMPVILFNRQSDGFSSVCMNDYTVGKKAAEFFYYRGHKTVAIINSNLPMKHHNIRQNGFVETCQKLALTLSPENNMNVGMSIPECESAAFSLLNSTRRPDAVFLSLSGMAPAICAAFKEKNIIVPEDIEVLGYGDSMACQVMRPSLSVIDLPIQEMVGKCIQMIFDMISGDLRQPIMIYEDTLLVIRESSGGIPSQQ